MSRRPAKAKAEKLKPVKGTDKTATPEPGAEPEPK
jgi:hypothetical protein